MSEKFGEQKEQEKKYTLLEENLIPLDINSEKRQENKKAFEGLSEEGINWPVEIQGGGKTDYKEKELKVLYPVGDIFASFVVTIHELGHLREKEVKEDRDRLEEEESAWQRGIERINDYAPEVLEYLEENFQKFKQKGELEKFNNFSEFYEYFHQVLIEANKIIEIFIKKKTDFSSFEFGKEFGKKLKNNKLINEFFSRQNVWKVGEKVDQKKIEGFIKKMAEKIAEEKYD